MEKKTKTRTLVILIVVLVILVAAILGVNLLNRQETETTAGVKTITLEVITETQTSPHSVSTEAEYLGEALQAERLIEGEDSEYGIFVKTVNGITADETREQWWCLTKGGADVLTGVDTTPIKDGDTFEFTLKTGY